MKQAASKTLILFLSCIFCLLMTGGVHAGGSDSLRTGFFVTTHSGVSPNFRIRSAGQNYPLENRLSYGVGFGIDRKVKRHFFIQFALSVYRVSGSYSAMDDTHYQQTGVITYSAVRYRYTCLLPHFNFSFPFAIGNIFLRPGFTIGAPVLNSLSKRDRISDVSSGISTQGNNRLSFQGGVSLLAGYQFNSRLTAWAGYGLEVISASIGSDAHPGSPTYDAYMGGKLHILKVTLCIALK